MTVFAYGLAYLREATALLEWLLDARTSAARLLQFERLKQPKYASNHRLIRHIQKNYLCCKNVIRYAENTTTGQ